MATFPYQPIDRSRNEIRLVHVLPSPDSAPRVECSLVHVSLDEQPVYQALSYTWDSNVFSETILLDGAPLEAICINQDDVVERNYEVLRMSISTSERIRYASGSEMQLMTAILLSIISKS
jgi:hypothetical protein